MAIVALADGAFDEARGHVAQALALDARDRFDHAFQAHVLTRDVRDGDPT